MSVCPPDWRDLAACRGMDTDLFYPGRGVSNREAKAACARCPVSDQCRDHAVERRELFGIWGGIGEGARRQLRKIPVQVAS